MDNQPVTYERRGRYTPRCRGSRRGVVLILVIVTVSISMVLFGLWAQNLVKEHRRFANQQFRMQATRLAEAGVRRAIARRAGAPQFTEEIWSVPAELLGGAHRGSVQIRVIPINDATALRYEATAQFPVNAVRRAQVTKRIEVSIPSTEDQS